MALKTSCNVVIDGNGNVSNMIEVWLQSIIDMLHSLPKNDEYRKKIQQWCIMREGTIKTLEELITALKNWHGEMVKWQFRGEVTSLVSDAVSVISGVLGMFGFISAEAAKSLGAAGQAGGIAGGAVSTVAAGAKNILEQQKATQAASVIKEDMTKSPKLLEFLEPSEALKETVDKVLDFNIFCRVINGYVNLFSETRNAVLNSNEAPTTLSDDIVKMVNHMPITEIEKEKVLEILSIIYRCYQCKKHLDFLINFRKEHPFVLHSALLIGRLFFNIRNLQVPATSLTSMAARGAVAASDTRDGIIIPGIFAVVDVINLLATKEELKEEDLDLVKRIREYMKTMKEELKLMKSFEERCMDPTYNVDC